VTLRELKINPSKVLDILEDRIVCVEVLFGPDVERALLAALP